MADLQRIFDSCKKEYDECYAVIAGMGDWLSERLDNGKKNRFRSNVLCKNFDVVLQFSLLQIAVADYDLDSKEVIFIRDLTLDGDLFEYLNSFVESKAEGLTLLKMVIPQAKIVSYILRKDKRKAHQNACILQ